MLDGIDYILVDKGINRNIVECKYDSESDMNVAYIELIETLWNVNEVEEEETEEGAEN